MNSKQEIERLKRRLLEQEVENASLLRELEQLHLNMQKRPLDAMLEQQLELARCRAIINLSSDMHFDLYPATMLTVFSEGYIRLTGWSRLIYQDFGELQSLVHPDDREKFLINIDLAIAGEESDIHDESRWLCADGEYVWLKSRLFGVKNSGGTTDFVLGLTNDHTEFRRQEAVLQEEKLKNQLLVKSATDYIWEFDVAHREFLFSRALCEILGKNEHRFVLDTADAPSPIPDFVQEEDTTEGQKTTKHIQIYSHKSDGFLWFEAAYFPLRTVKGKLYKYIGTMHNISEQKMYEEAARHDPLTGALNRRAADAALKKAFGSYKSSGKQSAVLFLDLDNFKKINDSCGHPAGDLMLKNLVELLKKSLPQGASAYRWGGEEFVILCQGKALPDAASYGEQVRALVEETATRWNGATLHVTSSIGVSQFLEGDTEPLAVVARADRALYAAKSKGKNAVCLQEA